MACPLKPEQQKALYIKVLKDLEGIQTSKGKFSLKDYLTSVYDLINDKKKDSNQAALIVQSTPDFVRAVAVTNQDLSDYLEENGLDLNEIGTLSRSFRKSVSNVIAYIRPVVNIQKEVELDKKAKLTEVKGQSETPKSAPIKVAPANWFATTGQQALHDPVDKIMQDQKVGRETAEAIQKKQISQNRANPAMQFYYDYIKDILSKLGQVDKVYITAIPGSQIPTDQLNAHDSNFVKYGGNLSQSVMIVVSDKNGNPLRLNEQFLRDPNGKMVYFPMRRVYRKDGKIDYKRSQMQTPQELAKVLPISESDIEKVIEQAASRSEGVQKYILEKPSNELTGFIIGGNKGYIPTIPGQKTDLSTIIFDQGFTIEVPTTTKAWTDAYIRIPGIEESILIKGKFLTPEDADKLASVLVDDLYINDELIVPADRARIFASWLNVSEKDVQYFPAENTIRIEGNVVDTTDKSIARKQIADFLMAPKVMRGSKPIADIAGRTVWKAGDPIPSRGTNFLIEKEEGGKKAYYWNNFRIYNARKDLTTINPLEITQEKEKLILSKDEVPYTNWIKDRFYTNAVPNAENKIVSLNGYLEYDFPADQLQLTTEAKKTIEEANKVPAVTTGQNLSLPDTERQRKLDNISKRLNDKLFKNYYQKKQGIKAIDDQVERAKRWYSSHPLSKRVPFWEMFNIINTANPNAVAEFTTSGIILFKGADYSDLYHEAWHAFTQLFLSQAEKTRLYSEAKAQEGTFTDFKGSRVNFSTASNLQLEEWLAEQFRTFMLTGKKPVAKVRKSIFQKLIDILRSLFGKLTPAEVARDGSSLKFIHGLFDQMKVGDLNNRTFDMNNVNFRILYSGIKRTTDKGIESLGYSDSKQTVDLIDGIITEIANESALRNGFYATEHDTLSDREARTVMYEEVLYRLGQRRLDNSNKLKQEEEANGKTSKADILRNRDAILSFIIDNYGSPTNLEADTGTVSYHFRNTQFLTQAEISDIAEDQILTTSDQGSAYTKEGESFTRTGNSTALEYLASPEVISLMRGIFEQKGENLLGARNFMKEGHVVNIISKTLLGSSDQTETFKRISEIARDEKADNNFLYQQLAIKLGNPEAGTPRSRSIWLKFQHFVGDKIRRELEQVNIHKTDVPGGHQVRFGVASGKGKGAELRWRNEFITINSPFMKVDGEGYYLDLPSLTEEYGYQIPVGKRLSFLRDIGISLSTKSDGTEYAKVSEFAQKDPSNTVDHIYEHIKWLANTEQKRIRNLPDLYKTRPKRRGWEGRFAKLAALEAEVSPVIGHMVSNAKGTTQYEFSLHSSNSKVVSAINNSATLSDILDPSGKFYFLNHLNPERNFFTRNSIWLNSLYDLTTGNRITHLDTFNAAGISLIDKNGDFLSGSALADADYISKLIGDIYTFSQGYIAEGTRTSDRSSTYLEHPSKIANPQVYLGEGLHKHSGKHYIDTPYFIKRGGETESKGRKFTRRIMIQKIKNELDRINYFTDPNLPASEKDKITGSGKTYQETGSDFVIFHNVLSGPTKKALKKINTDEDLYTYLRSNDPNLLSKLEKDINIYLNHLSDSLLSRVRNTGYPTVKLTEIFTNFDSSGNTLLDIYSVRPEEGKTFTQDELERGIIEAFVSNQWIHNYEVMSFFYGDLALYKGALGYVDRITGGPATGTSFLNDPLSIDLINSLSKIRPYAESDWFDETPPVTVGYNGSMNSAVLEDVTLQSIYDEQIAERLRADLEPTLISSGRYSQAEIEDLLAREVKAYKEITATDGQGFLSFDMYRILSILSSRGWSPEQETLFMKIVDKEKISHKDIKRLFPPLKLQYFGPLATTGAPVTAFHKFSLLPLIPTAIQSTALQTLHNKMVSQGIDYVLFKSGSKISHISRDGQTDKYFTDVQKNIHAFTDPDFKFTPNPIYTEFLKDQMSVPDEYKELSTFSTQLRRNITTGLLSEGVPVDFMPASSTETRRDSWSRLSDKEKLENKNYTQWKEFNDAVKVLTALKKAELNFEITTDKGELNIEKFVNIAKNELSRRGMGKHEQMFLDLLSSGKLKNLLDLSPSSKEFQRIFMSTIEKRLIRQKFPGEGLVQVSSVGQEKISEPSVTEADIIQMVKEGTVTELKKGKYKYLGITFTSSQKLIDHLNLQRGTDPSKLPAENRLKYGTNGLSFYHFDKDGKYHGYVEVKIALQGDFRKLLNLIHPDGSPAVTLKRLNEIIQSENFLKDPGNRRMISFLSPRIPGQSKASYDICQVKEFLPEEAGPIVIGPPEWLAKKGIDFDIDKEFTLFPRIMIDAKKQPVLAQFTESQIKGHWQQLRAGIERGTYMDREGLMRYTDPEVDRLMVLFFPELQTQPFTREEVGRVSNKMKLLSYKEFANKMHMFSAENRVLESISNILSNPKFYPDLVRPNGTYYFEKIADKLAPYTIDFDTSFDVFGETFPDPSPTRIFETESMIRWHQAYSIGMQALAIAAVDNASAAMFLEAGHPMRSVAAIQIGRNTFEIPQSLFLPHNISTHEGRPAISIGNLRNAEGFKMNEYNAQLITILVDIRKKPEIMLKLGINRLNFPTFSYLVTRSGVPLEPALYFINNPLVRDYIRTKSAAKSQFASALGIQLDNPKFFESKARDLILQKYGLLGPNEIYNFSKERFYNRVREAMTYRLPEGEITERVFSEEEMLDRLKEYKKLTDKGEAYVPSEMDANILLHYMEIEDQSRSVTNVKLATRFDIGRSGKIFTAHSRNLMVENARQEGRFSPELVGSIIERSYIGEFNLQPFIDQNLSPLFPITEHPVINQFLTEKMRDKREFRADRESTGIDTVEDFAERFKSDFLSFIYQNLLRGFNPSRVSAYKGLDIDRTTSPDNKIFNTTGVSADDTKIYLNSNKIQESYKLYTEGKKSPEAGALRLQYPPVGAIRSLDEFSHFQAEREYIRTFLKPSDLEFHPYYQTAVEYINDNLKGISEEDTKKIAYEHALRDIALDNIFNPWKIFESESAYAIQYEQIIKKHNLKAEYPVLQHIVVDPFRVGNSVRMWNLKQQTTRLAPWEYDVYHENLQMLANPSVIKVPDLKENERISEFFRKLPFIAHLQSFNAGTQFGLGRIVPYQDFVTFLDAGVQNYVDTLNKIRDNKLKPEILDIFYKKFLDNNHITNLRESFRFKNNLITTRDIDLYRQAKEKKASKAITVPAIGDLYTTPKFQFEAVETANANPDVIFVYNSRTGDPSKGAAASSKLGDALFGQKEITNSVGFPLKSEYIKPIFATDETLDQNKKTIDEVIETLKKYRDSGKRILFSPNGYGQSLIGADETTGDNLDPRRATAPETFFYLSKRLQEEFGYTNKNYTESQKILAEGKVLDININTLARETIIKCFI